MEDVTFTLLKAGETRNDSLVSVVRYVQTRSGVDGVW
jgi:hypothetical protein